MDKKLTTPVLFLAFNRPEKTKQSFAAIRQAKPTKLYIALDAPRDNKPEDQKLCKAVKKIVLNVDWECETHYLFQEKNLGCSLAGKTAWDWFFSQEDEMIFIEDDGVPCVSFFYYCQELLEKYRHDNRIAYIGGVNYGLKYGPYSYFFTRQCAATYSMATWKRVYKLYEYNMDSYLFVRDSKTFQNNFCSKFSYKFHLQKWDKYICSIKEDKRLNTYDTQMVYLVYKNDMYCIYPNVNMVSNIGLDRGGANNDINPKSKLALKFGNRPRYEISEIIHPKEFFVEKKFEKKMFKQRVLYDQPLIVAKLKYYILPIASVIYKKIKRIIGF